MPVQLPARVGVAARRGGADAGGGHPAHARTEQRRRGRAAGDQRRASAGARGGRRVRSAHHSEFLLRAREHRERLVARRRHAGPRDAEGAVRRRPVRGPQSASGRRVPDRLHADPPRNEQPVQPVESAVSVAAELQFHAAAAARSDDRSGAASDPAGEEERRSHRFAAAQRGDRAAHVRRAGLLGPRVREPQPRSADERAGAGARPGGEQRASGRGRARSRRSTSSRRRRRSRASSRPWPPRSSR